MKPIKKEQLDFLDWELGVFFHFGIRTFYEGHKDWDMQEMPAEGFNPTELDCDSWIKTIKDAGATYAILVCKHHDGFANWPSKYTEYSVKNTPWKNGKGDVVREYTDACRKYGLKVGLYYSPAEFGSKDKDNKDYDEYFINQVGELLTNYGKIDYIWFDGCGSEGHEYDTKRITAEIRRMQPGILIFNMWDPDTRWVGNESGVTHMPNQNIVTMLDFSVQTEAKEFLDEDTFLPVECDCRMRLANWFYSDQDEATIKSLDELMGLYYYSVGRGANLLINISPDRRGLLPEKDAERFLEFGNKIKEVFKSPLTDMTTITREGNEYTIALDTHTVIDHVVIKENITEGEKIQELKLYAYPYSYGQEILVYTAYSVGHKLICKIPPIRTSKLKLVVEKEAAPHEITDITVYKACE